MFNYLVKSFHAFLPGQCIFSGYSKGRRCFWITLGRVDTPWKMVYALEMCVVQVRGDEHRSSCSSQFLQATFYQQGGITTFVLLRKSTHVNNESLWLALTRDCTAGEIIQAHKRRYTMLECGRTCASWCRSAAARIHCSSECCRQTPGRLWNWTLTPLRTTRPSPGLRGERASVLSQCCSRRVLNSETAHKPYWQVCLIRLWLNNAEE